MQNQYHLGTVVDLLKSKALDPARSGCEAESSVDLERLTSRNTTDSRQVLAPTSNSVNARLGINEAGVSHYGFRRLRFRIYFPADVDSILPATACPSKFKIYRPSFAEPA